MIMKSLKLNINGVELEVAEKLNSGHYVLVGGIQVIKSGVNWIKKSLRNDRSNEVFIREVR